MPFIDKHEPGVRTMQCKIYFVTLSEADRMQLNLLGWDSPIGTKYHAAKDGDIAGNLDMFSLAAEGEFSGPEEVFTKLQNVHSGWNENPDIVCHTDFPRSMSVGDYIEWEDGKMQRCADYGFNEFTL